MPARQAVCGFIIGVAVTLCLAGPLAGGLAALTWPHIGGGHTEYAAARRIVEERRWRGFQSGERPAAVPLALPDPCRMRLELEEARNGAGSATISDLMFAISAEEVRRSGEKAEKPFLAAVENLPYPVIGALEGCLGRSLLSQLCDAYLIRRAEAFARRSPEWQAIETDRKQRMHQVWRLAAAAVPQRLAGDACR